MAALESANKRHAVTKNAHNINVDWIQIDDYSLREAAALNGLEPKFFDTIEATRYQRMERQARNLIVEKFIKYIDQEWLSTHEKALSSVRCGVYVIMLGNGFEVDYESGFHSPVIYIGKGGIRARLVSHSRGKLFDFWRSIGSVPFRFAFTAFDEEYGQDAPGICASLESHLLEAFDKRRPEQRVTPLLNKRKGVDAPTFGIRAFSRDWDRPLKRYGRGRTTNWLLKPSGRRIWKGALES